MALVRIDPTSRQANEVVGRLADELDEAAASARHAGENDLARTLEDRVEVLRWADSRQDADV